jgi:hypothetical protein
MDAAATRVIHLELSLVGESLTGCARDDLGASRRFDGRLGLLAAIDTLIADAPASGSEGEDR